MEGLQVDSPEQIQVPAADVERNAVKEGIAAFFSSLGFRLGRTIYRSRRDATAWNDMPPLPSRALHQSITKYDRITNDLADSSDVEDGEFLDLRELVKRANPLDYRADMTSAEALQLFRSKMVSELCENKTMLARGRLHFFKDANGESKVTLVRDHNWDWASPQVRGMTKRFFSLDRWPLGCQTEETRRKITNDEDINETMILDPRKEDSTEGTLVRPNLTRFGERKRKVIYRPGPRVYGIGDTRLQKRRVAENITETVSAGKPPFSIIR
jgi:hypothetical protein